MISVAQNLYAHAIKTDRLQRINAGLIDALYARLPVAQFATVVYAAVAIFVLRDAVPEKTRYSWFVLMLIASGGRALLWRAYSRARPSAGDAGLWGRWFAAGAAAAGILWGASAILFYVPGDLALQAFIAFTIGTVIVASALALGSHPRAFLAFALPAMLLLAGSFIAEGSEFSVVIGMMAVVLGVVLGALADNMHRSHVRALSLRIDNENLTGTLAMASEAAHAADLAKTAFLNSVSHELKTP